MAKIIDNTPSPEVLMNSMRSMGYSFKTALADIVDNSISANSKNVYITVPSNNYELYVSILDDGDGMNDDELFNAMKYGSIKGNYKPDDLGRFGLGLKAASLSQCKCLTVVSKKNDEINSYRWDLDEIIKTHKWSCIKLDEDDIDDIPQIDVLKCYEHGTLVVWQNFDIASKKNNGNVRDFILEETEYAHDHLRLVFHRFLNNNSKQFSIFINGNKLIPIDPFLENHPKTDSKKPSSFSIAGSEIIIRAYILPHQVDLSDDDLDKLGGKDALTKGQGFYIYRNKRLIVYGTWFRMPSSSLSRELMKYGRIAVDIPNSLDDLWDIDIKKQSATIPPQVLASLKKEVQRVNDRSSNKTNKRASLSFTQDNTRVWNKYSSRNEREYFKINKDSKIISTLLDDFDEKDRNKIIDLFDVISSTLPYDDIYSSMCNNKNENVISDEYKEGFIELAIQLCYMSKKKYRKPMDNILNEVLQNEPFNDEMVVQEVRRRLENEQ